MDKRVIAPDTAPEVATQMLLTEIIEKRYEDLSNDESESVRQHLAAHMNILTLARREGHDQVGDAAGKLGAGTTSHGGGATGEAKEGEKGSTPNSLLALVKRFINVREVDIDLIDSVNVFRERFEVASRSLDTRLLGNVQSAMLAMRITMTDSEAVTLWPRIKAFKAQFGRDPNSHSPDDLERRMAEALAWLKHGGFKSEVQHLAQPVRCEDDDEIPTTAVRRTRDACEPASAGTQPAIDRESAGAQSQFRQP